MSYECHHEGDCPGCPIHDPPPAEADADEAWWVWQEAWRDHQSRQEMP